LQFSNPPNVRFGSNPVAELRGDRRQVLLGKRIPPMSTAVSALGHAASPNLGSQS
jgi:hypothetical protein